MELLWLVGFNFARSVSGITLYGNTVNANVVFCDELMMKCVNYTLWGTSNYNALAGIDRK